MATEFLNHTAFLNKKLGKIKYSYACTNFDFASRTEGFALKYVTQGTEFYGIGQRIVPVKQGQFILLPKGQYYHVQGLKNTTTKGLCIDLYAKGLDHELLVNSQDALHTGISLDCSVSETLGKTLASTALMNDKQINDEQQASFVLESLEFELVNFVRKTQIFNTKLARLVKKPATRAQLLSKLIGAKEYIYSHYSSSTSLEKISKQAGLSKYHFQRLFKLVYDVSPSQLQDKLRIEQAKLLLLAKEKSLSNIAFKLGFSDTSAFIHKFRQLNGTTPGNYRRNRH